ncbi:MAG: fimbria/pilus periplasmic chaperone [Chitinophagaceae bacterium]|nr:fimbria/pilus periplasmic chaperone [Chitinophagaceae bacterium]
MKTKPFLQKILLIAFITFAFFLEQVSAQGNLLVTPKRVVFEGNKRSEELNLANTGTDTASYVISFIQIRMKEDGTFEQVSQPDSTLQTASNYLRFFPRSVTLAPNEAQSVKVQLIKTNEMQDGEYRSHMYFRGIPNNNRALGEEAQQKEDGISVKITPIFGLTLPVIIRRGIPDLKINISDLSFAFNEEQEPILRLRLNRKGNISSYGDININYKSNSGAITRVGLLKGLAVYTPNSARNLILKLDNNKTLDWKSGSLEITYTDQANQSLVLAESSLKLN